MKHVTFHRTVFRIRRGSFDRVERVFQHLGFQTFARLVTERDAAMWMGPKGATTVLQFNEDDAPQPAIEHKTFSHLAFLDNDPKAAVRDLAHWLEGVGVAVRTGQWSDREHWIDCPEFFVDFVIEVLHPTVVGE